jgi:CheY-like chemotaxis protein
MLIKVVNKDAEKTLVGNLVQAHTVQQTKSIVHCKFSNFTIERPSEDELVLMAKEFLADSDGIIYLCDDGDVFIQWDGAKSYVLKGITQAVQMHYMKQSGQSMPDEAFAYYDSYAHGEELRILCKQKIGTSLVLEQKEEKAPLNDKHINVDEKVQLDFDKHQKDTFNVQLSARKSRKGVEILVVEDQAFSRKLLLNLLERDYTCHAAKDAKEAIAKYAMYAPNITLLDIELPDMDGHSLAELFRRYDPKGALVMVTANNYVQDVEKAKNNKVNGFIIKPYNKNKILECIQKCVQ